MKYWEERINSLRFILSDNLAKGGQGEIANAFYFFEK